MGLVLRRGGRAPYWPWVQPLRSFVLQSQAEHLVSQLGPGAGIIAEIVPELQDKIPGLKPPPSLENPEQSRFRLFDAISTFLKTAASSRPIVVVLDDLHWADRPSLLLLQFLSRLISDSCLLVVGCYRDMELDRQHPLAEALGELTRGQHFQRVLLRGLSLEETGHCVQMEAGATLQPGLVETVHRRTEGNPLFVSEVARLLAQEEGATVGGADQGEAWGPRIPEGVREVIGRRLNRLSPDCNQLLRTASVIGREFMVDQLKPLMDQLPESRLLDGMEEALAARIIEEPPSQHPLAGLL